MHLLALLEAKEELPSLPSLWPMAVLNFLKLSFLTATKLVPRHHSHYSFPQQNYSSARNTFNKSRRKVLWSGRNFLTVKLSMSSKVRLLPTFGSQKKPHVGFLIPSSRCCCPFNSFYLSMVHFVLCHHSCYIELIRAAKSTQMCSHAAGMAAAALIYCQNLWWQKQESVDKNFGVFTWLVLSRRKESKSATTQTGHPNLRDLFPWTIRWLPRAP